MTAESVTNIIDFPPYTVPADLYRAGTARATVLLVPAMGTPARYYRPFAEDCARAGYNAVLPELPGTGTSTPRPSRKTDYGYRELVTAYLPALVGAARKRFGQAPLVLVGHSLGAHAGMLAVLQNTIRIDALVTLAGGHIHYRNWGRKGAGRVRLMGWLVTGLSYAFGAVPGRYLGLGSTQPRRLMREWSYVIRKGTFSHVAEKLDPAPGLPSLCIGYEGDFMAPSKSVAALAHLLGGDMEWLPVDWPGNPHASWARHPAETLRVIEAWLAARRVVSKA